MLKDIQPSDQIQRVEQRFQRRSKFAVHATLFIAYALFCLVFFLNPQFWRAFMTLPNTGDLLLILMIWAASFVAHGVSFYFHEAKDRAIQQELERKIVHVKRKRNRLSDDWDRVDDEDEEISDSQSTNRIL